MVLTSSLEVSRSPWQQCNGAGLIQPQGWTVAPVETRRSETYSNQSWSVLVAARLAAKEKTFCLHSYTALTSTFNSAPLPSFFVFLGLIISFSNPCSGFYFYSFTSGWLLSLIMTPPTLLCFFFSFSPTLVSIYLLSIYQYPHTLRLCLLTSFLHFFPWHSGLGTW